MNPLEYTVAIATKDRPGELRRCLRHVLRQKPLPRRILILDDGNLDPEEVESWLGEHTGLLDYRKKDRPGLVASYNLSGDLCTTEWLLSLDDDIYLRANFVRRLADVLRDRRFDPDRIGAITGYAAQKSVELPTPRLRARIWVERFFLINGFVEGRFLPSAHCTDYGRGEKGTEPYAVEHTPAGLVLWRANVLREMRYDEWFEGYAAGADKEIGLRTSKKYDVICQPRAVAVHVKSKRSRTPTRRLGAMKIRNQFFIYRRHFARHCFNRLCFYWALAGQFAILGTGSLFAANRRERLEELAGMTSAVIECVWGRSVTS